MLIICDTNIIIDFSRLKRLDILKDTFNEITLTSEVMEELLAGEDVKPGKSDIEMAINDWIKVKNIKDKFAMEGMMMHIGKGEASSIILYKEASADFFAVNDLKARGVAHALELNVIGMLGILRIAKDRGILKKIKPILDELKDIGAYINNNLYTRILKDVGEI